MQYSILLRNSKRLLAPLGLTSSTFQSLLSKAKMPSMPHHTNPGYPWLCRWPVVVKFLKSHRFGVHLYSGCVTLPPRGVSLRIPWAFALFIKHSKSWRKWPITTNNRGRGLELSRRYRAIAEARCAMFEDESMFFFVHTHMHLH